MQRETIRGKRRHNRITFNPNTVNMGEKLYITIPKLDNETSIVPGTTHLIYNLKNSNAKSWPLNNLGRLLIQGLQIKLGRDVVYDNTRENVFRLYKDLWMSDRQRNSMVGKGIASEGTQKHLGGSDDASTSSTTNGGIKDKDQADLFRNQRIPLGQILDDHGLHAPRGHGFDTKYTITLPEKASDIGKAQSGESVGNFSLENLELEYDTIQNQGVVDAARDEMTGGKNYIIQHVSLESITTWEKGATLVNENLHLSRQSLKAIVYLFKWVDQVLDEEFVYPNIEEVSCQVNGQPNVIHSNVMRTDQMEKEARRYFQRNDHEIASGSFFNSKFSVVLDFRGLPSAERYNNGIEVIGTSGIQTTFKRKATTKNVICYTFVISDSIVQIDSSGYQNTLI